MATNPDPVKVARSLTRFQRYAIVKIGNAGPSGLSTFGWEVNWFSVALMMKKFPGVLDGTGERWSARTFLTPFGLAVRAQLLKGQDDAGGTSNGHD